MERATVSVKVVSFVAESLAVKGVIRIFNQLEMTSNTNNCMSNFNTFPTDNSSTTNLKYDIITSKMMTGVRNHQRRNTPASTSSFDAVFYIIGAAAQLVLAIVVLLSIGLHWLWKQQ